MDSFVLAWKYIRFNKMKTIILVTCLTIILALPMALDRLLSESEDQLLSRAVSTPLILGAKGSALDLVMNTLYFGDETPEPISMKASEDIVDNDLALPIPMYVRFKVRQHPIVGTTLDYFDFRGLKVDRGQPLTSLGECVVGAKVAQQLNVAPGDSLISTPENLFDLAGVYPLKMRVAGILEKSHSSDDMAVFVDIKTAWVIQGLAHGHQDLTKTQDGSVILNRAEGNVTANAKLVQYTEITKENMDSFHFHGNPSLYPITAVMVVPYDAKSGTLLQGRYLEKDSPYQIFHPKHVVEELLKNIFRIKNVLDAVIGFVGFATVLAIILVFSLSLRLRQREINTIFRLGCSRLMVARLLIAEILITALMSGIICTILVVIVEMNANSLVRMLFIR
ncbi:hypothetical protein BVX98_01400 [bacterium F11]|nr:hypothetical protein BVX98_01400 [bacterium F11]